MNRQPAAGFSFVEVLVAAVILMIFTTSSLQLFLRSSESFVDARLRDDAATRISRDLEQLRRLASRAWRCVPGGSGADACAFSTATAAFSDGQIAYTPPAAGCLAGDLAVRLVAAAPADFAASLTLPTTDSPPGAVAITRSLSASGNQLTVRYRTASGARFSLDQTTTLVPEAHGWCP